ncbi:MAG: hypothetical protein Fur0021_27300 [Candidatus Promineifilaceae bacterium]
MLDGSVYACVNLSHLFNGFAASSDLNRESGCFSYISHCSYPAEELPPANEMVILGGIPFLFPNTTGGQKDNIEAEEQVLWLPDISAHIAVVLGACDTTKYQETIFIQAGGEQQIYTLGLSSWIDAFPDYGNRLAWQGTHLHATTKDLPSIKPALWMASLSLNSTAPIEAVFLPYNPSLHIFALTFLTRLAREVS